MPTGKRNGRDGVVVVGASVGGLSTVEALRKRGFTGRVTLLGAEKHRPYDRPPLSKQVLSGAWEPEKTRLRPEEALEKLGADFVHGDPAVGLDTGTLGVRTASGRTLGAETVVVATGLRPRTLPGQDELAGTHVLRSLEDTLALRAELATSERVAVVGDGVLGTEIAATVRAMGNDVTLLGPQPAPMAEQLGPNAAELLSALHTERGVRLRLGTGVTGLSGSGGRVAGVRLENGQTVPADTVIVSIGADPVTAWLAGSGLSTENGLVCDSRCRAAEGVYAVGDVARWHHEDLGRSLRLENRTNAVAQAAAVAAGIVGGHEAYRPVPYFWTDQFDVKIQVYGVPSPDAEFGVVEGDVDSGRFVAEYRENGTVTAVLGWRMPKQARMRAAATVLART